MRQTFELPIALPGLNGSKGLIRQHWSNASKMKAWLLHEVIAAELRSHEGQVRITYTRTAKKRMDWDNCMSSAKHVLDALVKAVVIKDDSPKFIPEQPKMFQEIGEPRTVIVIEDIDP
jgi:Holliday junction resolvase RusA-like endonuclease